LRRFDPTVERDFAPRFCFMKLLFLPMAIFLMALLYSSVGHGGASGYLAAMALFGVPPEIMRPSALTLNLIVSLIAALQFYREGHFSWRLFSMFAAASIPAAYLGGSIHLPTRVYKPLVGCVLLFAAWRLWTSLRGGSEEVKDPPLALALLLGGLIGLLSGLTGVGGGIFLSPLLILAGWATARQTAGISAAFIFVNSAAGLMGNPASLRLLPSSFPFWAAAALIGGLIGSELGRRRLPPRTLRRVLALVLVVAGLKMIFG
jgi:uncharacterized membrane protein YfcA